MVCFLYLHFVKKNTYTTEAAKDKPLITIPIVIGKSIKRVDKEVNKSAKGNAKKKITMSFCLNSSFDIKTPRIFVMFYSWLTRIA